MHKNDRLRPWETALLAAVCVTLLTGVWAQGRQSALADKVVRLHVIAASDSAEDQRVKLEVRDALLAYLTPRLEAASGAQDAAAVIAAASGELQRIAETASGGSARVELGRETYPTREYETFSRVYVASYNARRGQRAKLVVRGVSSALYIGRGDRAGSRRALR